MSGQNQSGEITEGSGTRNSTFETKLEASGDFFFFLYSGCLSVSSCFLTTRQDLAELKHSTKTTKPPPGCQTLRPATLWLSLCFCVYVSRSSEWGNGTFYCVILPLGRTEGRNGGRRGVFRDKANFVLCGFSVVSESSPTLPPPQASSFTFSVSLPSFFLSPLDLSSSFPFFF